MNNSLFKVINKIRQEGVESYSAFRYRVRLLVTGFLQSEAYKALKRKYKGRYISHFGLHAPGNAGDTLLFPATRKLIDNTIGPYNWALEPLRKKVSTEAIDRINKDSMGIIIGGGGLLLRDTNPNKNSGWQWNCPKELVAKIKVPIIVFAIGYNRFRGQEDFDPIFSIHIKELVQKSKFFGLRSRGSVNALAKYLDEDLACKLCFQPCPTTLLRYIYPEYRKTDSEKNVRNLALNIAFDREEMRFGQKVNDILTAVARAIEKAVQGGWTVHLVVHYAQDANIIPWLRYEGVNFTEVNLERKPINRILDFYQKMSLTIGMRGHSQLIPFGLGTPIISLISHDKLKWFLEDVGHPEWGVDVMDPKLEEQLTEKIKFVDVKNDTIKEQIDQAQKTFWETTLQNLEKIKGAL